MTASRGRGVGARPDQKAGNQRMGCVPARAIDDPALSNIGLRVLNVLALYGDRDGWCWPAVETVAARARCSERHARRALRELEQLGHLQRHERAGQSNWWHIIFDPRADTGVRPNSHEGRTPVSAPARGASYPQPRTPVSGEGGHQLCPAEHPIELFSSGESSSIPARAAKEAKREAWLAKVRAALLRVHGGDHEHVDTLIEQFRQGDKAAVKLINRASRMLARGAGQQRRLAIGGGR